MQAVASTRWAQIALHEKPCVLLNSDDYYDYLFKFLDHAVAEGLLKGKNRALALQALTCPFHLIDPNGFRARPR